MASKQDPIRAKLIGWLTRRGTPKPDAEDFVHDAWIRMVEYGENHQVELPEAFLRRALVNRIIDARRERATRGELVVWDDEEVAVAAPSVEQTVIRRELLVEVAQAMLDLDDVTQAIASDRLVLGMTYGEIAAKHGVSLRTVHRRLSKAMFVIAAWRQRRARKP